MSLKLKALLLAAMAMTAISAIGVTSAQAFTQFNNPQGGVTTVTSTPDGTGKAAHHVFVTPAGSITCNTVDLHGTTEDKPSAPTQTLTFTYNTCKFNGINTTVEAHGCAYVFNANGEVNVECPGSEAITFEAAGCKVSVGAQALTGIGYANINGNTEITATANVSNIHGVAEGCPSGNGTFTTGQYTTGNTIITGSDPSSGAMKPINVS